MYRCPMALVPSKNPRAPHAVRVALACTLCATLALATSPQLRKELAVMANGANAALIHAGALRLGQLAVDHVRPARHPAPYAIEPDRHATLPTIGAFDGTFTRQDGTVTLHPDIPPTATEAVVTLDLWLLGSWDARHPRYGAVEGDGIVFSVNGVPFHRALFQNWGRSAPYRTAQVQIGQTTVALTLLRESTEGDYRAKGKAFDTLWSVRLEATGHPHALRLGLHATANDPSDEHFALSHVQVFHD